MQGKERAWLGWGLQDTQTRPRDLSPALCFFPSRFAPISSRILVSLRDGCFPQWGGATIHRDYSSSLALSLTQTRPILASHDSDREREREQSHFQCAYRFSRRPSFQRETREGEEAEKNSGDGSAKIGSGKDLESVFRREIFQSDEESPAVIFYVQNKKEEGENCLVGRSGPLSVRALNNAALQLGHAHCLSE